MKPATKNKIFSLWIVLMLIAISCTKLDTKVYDQVSNFWRTPDEIAAGVAPAYSWLRNIVPGGPDVYSLNELSTDEIIVPIRGSEWVDERVWEQMWEHSWGPEHRFFSEAWESIYGGIARVNSILQTLNEINPEPADIKAIQAELKTVRAFYNFLALDLFGNVPIDSNYTDTSKSPTRPRAEVFSYVEKELKDNLDFLTADVNLKTYGRATKWFVEAILAKLYLNAQVYTGVSRWADCIEACDAILDSHKYSLEPDFFSNFKIANEGSKENIFVIPFDRIAGLDAFVLQLFTLHYNSPQTFGLHGFCANGFCSTAEYYSLFDPRDKRRKMFLVGQQYKNQDSTDPANIQYDRSGRHLLIFDPNIPTFSLQDPIIETAGARCAKWEFNKDGWGNMSNDFAVFRLADIILMKAEAQFRNGSAAEALATINQKINGVSIRSRAGLPDFTAAEMNPEGLLKERACELSWEGWRRNDMIRLGHFTDERVPEKGKDLDDHRMLYPIPKNEMAKNPYLKQNPGY